MRPGENDGSQKELTAQSRHRTSHRFCTFEIRRASTAVQARSDVSVPNALLPISSNRRDSRTRLPLLGRLCATPQTSLTVHERLLASDSASCIARWRSSIRAFSAGEKFCGQHGTHKAKVRQEPTEPRRSRCVVRQDLIKSGRRPQQEDCRPPRATAKPRSS